MASLKKELKSVLKRFDVATDAFMEGTKESKKSRKALKGAEAKIKNLELKVASLEQRLKVAKDTDTASTKTSEKKRRTLADTATRGGGRKSSMNARKTTPRKSSSTGARRGRPKKEVPIDPKDLTRIDGIGATMAARFKAAGVNTIKEFSTTSNDEMKKVFDASGPRYRNVDEDKMDQFRSSAADLTKSDEAAGVTA